MNFFVLAPLMATVINSFLGIFVFSRNPKAHINRLYFLFSICLVVWNFGVLLMFFAQTPEQALLISRSLHFGVIFLPFFLIHTVFLILGFKLNRAYYFVYLIPVLLAATNLTDLFIKSIEESPYSYYGVAGPGFHVFSFFLFLIFLSFFVAVFRKKKTAKDFERKKVNSLIWAYFILLFSGIHDTLPVFEIYQYPIIQITVYPLGMIGSIIFAVFLAYSVLQHQILNIYTNLGRVAATCARLFLLFLLFFVSILTLAMVFPEKFTYFALFSSIILFLIIGTIGSILFPKIIGVGEEHFEKRILGDRFEYQDKIRTFTKEILYYSSNRSLYENLQETLVHIFQFHNYSLFILDEKSESYILLQSHPRVDTTDSYILPANSPIAEYFKKPANGLLSAFDDRDFMNLDELDEEHKKPLRDLQPKLCFALWSGNELLGFLMLGDKIGNRPITNLDLQLLNELTTNLGLFINQSRLKKQVAQSQEMELLGNLSRGLAHDLNNLITPVSTYCQLTEDVVDHNESLKLFGEVAQRNLSTMQAYIREALFFSTNQEPKVRRIAISKIIDNIKGLYQTPLAARKIKLNASCPDDIVMTVDDILIQRLLSNLIHNAADASPEDSEVELTVTELNHSFLKKKWIRFIVQDHGSGISEAELEKVFTPYFTTKDIGDNKRGSGLGLSICRRIVHLHKGTINITSAIGKGTQVIVDLPENNPSDETRATKLAEKDNASPPEKVPASKANG